MSRAFPENRTVSAAVALAIRAPSVHNTQPWSWRVGARSVHLYADLDRRLPETDPDGRDLVISCGATLHHLRVAFAALGWSSEVHRLPNPAEPTHLASVELRPHEPTRREAQLCAAITARRSDRRAFSSQPVNGALVDQLGSCAAAEGTVLRVADEAACEETVAATLRAAQWHLNDPSYRCELARWSGKRFSEDGVPSANTPPITKLPGGMPNRRFSNPWLWGAHPQDADKSGGELLTLSTEEDDRLSQLRAGEAMSAVLLAATSQGLASCALSEALEVRATREQIQGHVTEGRYPQIILRVGWPGQNLPVLAQTWRRPVHDVLGPLSIAQLYEHLS